MAAADSSSCPNELHQWTPSRADTFPLPDVVSRFPENGNASKSSATGVAPPTNLPNSTAEPLLSKPEGIQDERWLQGAMDWLMDALNTE